MILNQRQYQVTKAQMVRLRKTLELSIESREKMDKRVFRSMIVGIKSQINELKKQINEYEEIQNAEYLVYSSIGELPNILIKARVARGYTQKDLAKKLNIDTQQIQRYEKSNYSSVSLARAIAIFKALGIDLKGTIPLQVPKVG
jgi:HTH-type transcriptional regulator/antitoxin HigA